MRVPVWVVSGWLLVTVGCEPPTISEIPPELRGRWITESPKFEDRYMEFERLRVVFGQGEGESTGHAVHSITADQRTSDTIYHITYISEAGEEYVLTLFYYPRTRTLRLRNRWRTMWKRQDAGAPRSAEILASS